MKRQRTDIKKIIKKKIEIRHTKLVTINRNGSLSGSQSSSKVVPVNVSLSKKDVRLLQKVRNVELVGKEIPYSIKQTENAVGEAIEKFYSIVIPTMWKSNKIHGMLPVYENSKFIKEIIIIDNNPNKKIDLSGYKKVRYYTKGKNIYVNPSWNWGYALSNYNLILTNDDIIINDFNKVMKTISNSNYDIIGIDVAQIDNSDNIRIDEIENFPQKNYGCFMFIKKYTYIPDQLKIWYGDKILFDFNKKRGIIRNAEIIADKSITVNSNMKLFREDLGRRDIQQYELIKKNSDELNIIVRTSGRPLFFEKCIESIRKNYHTAKLHITIDEITDLNYVKKYASDFDYTYYLIEKEIVGEMCKKVQINRESFIYNYYFNVVKPFLDGWCMFLDDDDELLIKPSFENNLKNIYLYKVDIGIKIVPDYLHFGKTPVLNNISGLGIIFHSSQMVDWKPERGGDYNFISELYKTNNPVWINEIISKTQKGGNFGKRNDLNE